MFDSVPQMQQPGSANRRMLTSSQHSELEMARRRAEKAAEGKRANAEAAKQRFKRKKGERAEAARVDTEERQGNEEIEHKLSIIEDQKEAKRLKRCCHHDQLGVAVLMLYCILYLISLLRQLMY